MPALHAGWALWVAIVSYQVNVSKPWKQLAQFYAATTAVVIIGTGNHWTLDVAAGRAVVVMAYLVVTRAVHGPSFQALSPPPGRAQHISGG